MSHLDEGDQDSLFGSPPPSPARGRSPAPITLVQRGETSSGIATPTAGAPEKNVGTIALPGSHMSCSELPANLPAARLSLPCHTSGLGPLSAQAHDRDHPPALTYSEVVSLPRSRSSRAGSVLSASRSSTSSTRSATVVRKRKTYKAKSITPVSPPPIPIPGPHEPTPPNFLRSQSALLGLAGVVGSVKPAHLHTHERGSIHSQSSRAEARGDGSTPANPIVVDEDEPRAERSPVFIQDQLDQVNLGKLQAKVLVTLARQKNIFPVLESLIKLLGGVPHATPSVYPQTEPFARPYGYGIRDTPAPTSTDSTSASASRSSTVSTDTSDDRSPPPPKRRKLSRVPAGATDWDVPFPFASGEGPEAYRATWAQERGKQLVVQLLEVLKDAVDKAMARSAKKSLRRGREAPGKGSQSNVGMTSERHAEQAPHPTIEVDAVEETSSNMLPSTGGGDPASPLNRFLTALCGAEPFARGLSEELETLTAEGAREGGDGQESAPFDHAAFEEWLSQLEAFVPPESSASGPGPDVFSDLGHDNANVVGFDESSLSGPSSRASLQQESVDSTATSHIITDDSIDPILLGISIKDAMSLPLKPQSTMHATTPMSPATRPQLQSHEHMAPTPPPPPLTFSPRTSLSSLTEPLTPHSDAFGEPAIYMSTGADHYHDYVQAQSNVETVDSAVVAPGSYSPTQGQTIMARTAPEPSQTEEPQRLTAIQKGKGKAIATPTPRASSKSTTTSRGKKVSLAKDDILERARERRRQLVAEIERAKIELWETSIEGGVLIHLAKDSSL
ncbi:hypothetical protein F5I97DRAFT_1891490 [Phlebopus sp. FC_14]|nr:hypothetical protein F5I97DRAFT_1891490 [Phlebopus sp. FC_14]